MNFEDIRGILRYVPQFRGQTFVVLIEGEVIDSENFQNVLLDIAVLHSLSIKVAVVHGARHQMRKLAGERGVQLSSVDGIDATDDATLSIAMDAISRMGSELLQHMTSVGLRASLTNAVIAHPAGVIKGKDMGHTGAIDRIDAQALQNLIDSGTTPVISPLGYERQGRILRLNASATAVQVALALRASKLLFVIPRAIENPKGRRVRQLSIEEAKALAEVIPDDAEHSQGFQLRCAAQACENGVPRVQFVDGRLDEALLGELFSPEGVGTMVHRDEYQQIRPARRSDIPTIISMIRRAVDDDELVSRSRQDIRDNLGDYFTLDVDGHSVAVVAVHVYPEEKMAEIGCLYVRNSYQGQGHGKRMVSFAEKRARELGAARAFALSTQAINFFDHTLGYDPADASVLPPERRVKLEKSGRNSRIMVKSLTQK